MIVLLVVAFLLAATYTSLGYLHWHGFHIDHEIKPVDVATLLVNISIAILLQYFFLSRSGNLRAEKDLIIDDIKSVVTRLKESNDHFLQRVEKKKSLREEWRTSVIQCRAIANGLEALEFSLGSTKCRKCHSLKSKFKEMKEKFFEYKRAVTGSAATKPIGVDAISEQSQMFRSLMRDLQAIVFDVNRH